MARTKPCWEIVVSLNTLNGSLSKLLPAPVAAAQWAGIAAPYPELVDTLNRKQGNRLPNYLELDGVCNQLAGTVGLTAQDALSRLAGN